MSFVGDRAGLTDRLWNSQLTFPLGNTSEIEHPPHIIRNKITRSSEQCKTAHNSKFSL